MTGPDEPTRPLRAGGHASDHGSDGSENLDLREEWGPADEPADDASEFAVTASQTEVRRGPVDEPPKKKVRGIARGVDLRTDLSQQQEKLIFRVDRYDVAGNRLTPVPVEMRRYRGGLVTDGDEVEVVGRWSRGTLRASRITNLTTDSEVRSWFAGAGKWVALALGVALLTIIGIVLILLLSSDTAAHTVKVPNVVGQDPAAARNAIRHVGLKPEIRTQTEPSDAVPAGSVAATQPPADFPLSKGGSVTIFLSSGAPAGPSPVPVEPSVPPPTAPPPTAPPPTTPPPVTIEAVAGKSGAAATNQLRDQGLVVKVVDEGTDAAPAGIAFRTDPAGGTVVAAGSTVTLFVSNGPATTP